MTAPRKPPITKKIADDDKDDEKSLLSTGLSAMSLIVKKEIRMNKKWSVIQRVMALRGFDVADQRTIRILCEDAQSNIEATK